MQAEGDRYQYGFAAMHPAAMYDERGRARKAAKALAVMADFAGRPGGPGELSGLSLLDIGCSAGYLSRRYADAFRSVVAVDIDEAAIEHARANSSGGNLRFDTADAMALPFPDESFDAVTCTHIYEHVPDADRMMAEILRVLRPGGFCFFVAGNRLVLVEAHYRLPLLSVMPQAMAHRYLRMVQRGSHYYENHRTLRSLRDLVRAFEVTDYTRSVIAEPQRFRAEEMVRAGSLRQRAALGMVRYAYWACPTYVWVLTRPAEAPATAQAG